MKLQNRWETPASSDRRGEFLPNRIEVEDRALVEHVVIRVWSGRRSVTRLVLTSQDSQTLTSLLIQSNDGGHSPELMGLLGVLLTTLRRAGVNDKAVLTAVKAILRRSAADDANGSKIQQL